MQRPAPINIYYAYAEQDEALRQELEKHLSTLRRQGLIADWHKHKILAGSERERAIDEHLNSAALILLLLSPDFMASDYCYGVEMRRAMERFEAGEASVIPVMLRHVDIVGAPFERLQCLPDDGRPVDGPDKDAALHNVVKHIRRALGLPEGEAPRQEQRAVHPGGRGLDQRELRNRRNFLLGFRATWIRDMLGGSLYHDTLIALGLKEQPDAVANPFRLLIQETDREPRALEAGIRISQVYEEANGALLILGEPGAGKTTLLLELARDLLERAEADIDQPMPAIFTLATWARKGARLEDWLIGELETLYYVPPDVGRAWPGSEQLILLLDGLDEVKEEQRSACVAAINQFRHEHPYVSLVVSCRRAEYLAQERRVDLRQAVIVQPLTDHQIDEYVSEAGPKLEALSRALSADSDLRELACSPLMLNILSLTYQGSTQAEIAVGGSPEELRGCIFENYVARMFKRRGRETRYAAHDVKHWLGFLARYMKRALQTTFFVDRLSAQIFTGSSLYGYYRALCVLLCCLFSLFLGILVVGLVAYKSGGIEVVVRSEPPFLGMAGTGLVIFLFGVVGLIIGMSNPHIRPMIGLNGEAIMAMVFRRWLNIILSMILFATTNVLDINASSILYLIIVSLVGALVGVIFGVFFNLLLEYPINFVPKTEHIIKPNREIYLMAIRASLAFLVCVMYGLIFLLIFGNRLTAILSLSMGYIFGLGFGGLVVIQHYVLRFLLWRAGLLPWGLVPFLDGAVERIFLRRVGGGYIFVHRLLLDYFAGLGDAGDAEG